MKIKLKEGREKLSEGRNFGLGFAFAKLIEEGLQAVMPISACKDYLNDVLYTELTGKKLGTIYGFSYGDKKDIILKSGYAFLLFSVLDFSLEKKWPIKDSYIKKFTEGIKNCQEFVNIFCREILQEEIDFKIVQNQENLFWCIVPPIFLTNTYGISLLTLLLRNGYKYQPGSPIKKFLEKPPNDDYTSDVYMLFDLCKIINEKNLAYFIRKPQVNGLNIRDVHNNGLISLKYNKK